jgi:hypothetical protein
MRVGWLRSTCRGGWYTFHARHNCRRIGRVLIGLGNDAADVSITMSFGKSSLEAFHVFTEEVDSVVSDGPIVEAA